jgi:predicted nucleic acid-binding protein
MSAEAVKEFVDTNVLVYAHDETVPDKHIRARELVDGLWDRGAGAISVQVLQEFYVTVTQKIPRPVDKGVAGSLVALLGQWTVHAPGVSDVLAAIEVHRRAKISLWDALIVRSAQELGCTLLWTEDLTGGRMYDGVRVRNPFEG